MKEKIVNICEQLGMIDEGAKETPKLNSLIDKINFVDELFIYNDEATIKKLLLVLLDTEQDKE